MKQHFQKYRIFIYAFLLWCAIFIVYLYTLAPTVGYIDSGELAAVASTLGIAHPTGYPIFTLLGKIFSDLPFASEEIVRLNVMSALFTSLAVVAFFFLLIELFGNEAKKDDDSNIVASISAALALAFSQTFWKQGVTLEVYSLHLLMISLTMLFFIKAIRTDKASHWFLFAYILGISFTNHLTTILLAPAFLYLFFIEHRFTKIAFQRILKLTVPFFLGLSVYLYLPIRASSQPILNWGNPQTFEKIWWHISGKQFRVWMFASTDVMKKQFNVFIDNLSIEYFYFSLVIALVGFFSLLISDRKKFLFVFLLMLGCILYAINYDIHDIDAYFLLAFIAIAIFVGFGMKRIVQSVHLFQQPIIGIVLIIILTGIQLNHNWNKVDQSDNYMVEDYTKNILSNLPQNAIILSYQWDYFVSASYYFQHVKKLRPDVIVLDKELFRRSWYFPQLEKLHPELMEKSSPEIDLFNRELFKFEHNLPYDNALIESRYTELLMSFIKNSMNHNPFFITPEVEQNYTSGFFRIPEGFAYRLNRENSYIFSEIPRFEYRECNNSDIYGNQIKKFSSSILQQRGIYERFNGKDSLSVIYLSKASLISSFSSKVSHF